MCAVRFADQSAQLSTVQTSSRQRAVRWQGQRQVPLWMSYEVLNRVLFERSRKEKVCMEILHSL
jgi:hypothetical protein